MTSFLPALACIIVSYELACHLALCEYYIACLPPLTLWLYGRINMCKIVITNHYFLVVQFLLQLCNINGSLVMCSCSLCSKNLSCWTSFRDHFKSLHGVDMQQCTQCSEPVPSGVLMVQHMTQKHLVRCSVVLRRMLLTDVC